MRKFSFMMLLAALFITTASVEAKALHVRKLLPKIRSVVPQKLPGIVLMLKVTWQKPKKLKLQETKSWPIFLSNVLKPNP